MKSSEQAWRGKAANVYALLRSDIESGRLAPGQTIPETELVAYTGASRTPVREAVRLLASDGLIELEPRRAPTVSRISLRSARSLFDFRRLLEPEAMRLTAIKAPSDSTIVDMFTEFERIFTELRGAEYTDEFAARFKEVTTDFDAAVARFAGNDFLSRSIADLRPHSARLRSIAHADTGRLQESVVEHLAMCRAIIEGNPERAGEMMREHLDHVDQAIFHQLIDSGSAHGAEVLVG